MKLNKIPRTSLFKQYLTSYLLVFFIPLIIFLIVINAVYIQSIQEEVSTTNSNALEQVSLQFDEQIFEMNTVGNQINYSNQFLPHILSQEKDFTEQIELLKFHANSTRSTNGIYVYLNKKDQIISSKGIMSTEGLLSNDHNFDIIEREDFLNQIKKPTEMVTSYTLDKYIKTDFDKKVIYYTMPLSKPHLEFGTLIFVVNMDPITSSLKAIESGSNKRTNFILDHNDELVLAQGNIEPLIKTDFLNEISQIIKEKEEQSKYLNYTLASNTSQLSGWKFITFIETAQLYQPFYRILFFFGIGIIVITVLGFVISMYFSMKNYNPIRGLLKSFTENTGTSVSNEWSYIKYNITKTQSEHKLLNQLMDEQAPIIRNTTLLNLIEGKSHKNNRVLFNELKEVNISFPYSLFSLLIIDFDEKLIETENIFDLESIVQNLTKIKTDEFILEATIPYLNNSQILVIVNHKQEGKKQWDKIFHILNNTIEEVDLLQESLYKIAIGDTYSSLDKIQTSYIEANYALKTGQHHEGDFPQITFFKEVAHQDAEKFSDQIIKYPETKMSVLIQSLEKGNEQTALETLDLLFEDLSEYNQPEISTQLIVSYIFNKILKMAIAYNLDNLEEEYLLIQNLTSFTDLTTIKDVLTNLIIEISEHVLEKQQIENIEIEKNVVNYIYENYQSPEISLEQIASNNNVSISYASKLIKEETGESFSNIIQNLRMDKFKEMLINTNRPIKDLVKEIGYYDVSNFTRKFREENNVTPGKYRKQYKK